MANITQLFKKGPIIFDGAMGTELQKRGLHQDPAILNLSHPESIIDLHCEYLKAGADVLTANTFGAYSYKYPNAKDMIKAAISHGRKALEGHPGKLLALDLGPTGLLLEPYGDTTPEECSAIFEEAVSTGISYGVDLILVETMMDLTELELAVRAAKNTCLPVIATMTFDKNGKTMMGASIDDMVNLLANLKVDALGMNCGFGPDIYTKLASELISKTSLPIIVQPNAGLPIPNESTDKNSIGAPRYNLSVEEFSEAMAAMHTLGVTLLGGCCGTTPEHILALANQVKPSY